MSSMNERVADMCRPRPLSPSSRACDVVSQVAICRVDVVGGGSGVGWCRQSPRRGGTRPLGAFPVLKTAHGEIEIFPADNPWNTRVDRHKVHPKSTEFLRSIGESANLHPDFGTVWNGAPAGIPYVVVGPDQPRVPVRFEYPTRAIPVRTRYRSTPRSRGDRRATATATFWSSIRKQRSCTSCSAVIAKGRGIGRGAARCST